MARRTWPTSLAAVSLPNKEFDDVYISKTKNETLRRDFCTLARENQIEIILSLFDYAL